MIYGRKQLSNSYEQETFSMCHARRISRQSFLGLQNINIELEEEMLDWLESWDITDDPHINCSIISGTKQHH